MTNPVSSQPSFRTLDDLQDLGRSSLLSRYRSKLEDAGVSPRASFPRKLGALLDRNFIPWLTSYLKYAFKRRHYFQSYGRLGTSGIYPLATSGSGDAVRVAIAGDWASGTAESDQIAKRITDFKPHFAIHLGDVYYVGDDREVRENFLGQASPGVLPITWPSGSGGTFALNGNHEMYANGNAYFDLMLPTLVIRNDTSGVASGQPASFFCLINDHWLLLGLDTGYNSIGVPILSKIPLLNRLRFIDGSCRLEPALTDWLGSQVMPLASGRGVVLLSHHQYYSAFDKEYALVGRQLAEFFREPVLWYWGHEHRVAVYGCYGFDRGIRAFGRCVGHGGMPVYLKPPRRSDRGLLWHDARLSQTIGRDAIGFNGYATMVFDGDALTVEHRDLNDTLLMQEQWKTANGQLRLISSQ